jgi:membrane-associated protein
LFCIKPFNNLLATFRKTLEKGYTLGMNFSVQVILPYILLYKYWAIFGVTFVAALALPVPPGYFLMASAALASQGYFDLGWVIMIGVAGNIVGDNTGYWLARIYGKKVLHKIGFGKAMDSNKYRAIEKRLRNSEWLIILVSRFEVFSNLAVNIICGLGEVKYRRYLIFEALGELLQVTLYCSIGYFFGDNWQAIGKLINNSLLAIIIVLIMLGILFRKRILRWFKGA